VAVALQRQRGGEPGDAGTDDGDLHTPIIAATAV
jgi:hypothetical protein